MTEISTAGRRRLERKEEAEADESRLRGASKSEAREGEGTGGEGEGGKERGGGEGDGLRRVGTKDETGTGRMCSMCNVGD